VRNTGKCVTIRYVDKNLPFTAEVVRSIRQIDEEEWNGSFPPHPEDYRFYTALHDALEDQFELSYLVIRNGAQCVCIIPCFLTDYALDTTADGPLKTILSSVRAALPGLFTVRAFVCGSPATDGRLPVDFPRHEEAASLAIGTLRSIAREKKASFLAFKDFPEEPVLFFESLAREGFRAVRTYPSVNLKIGFSSFEEYLASLSRATRKDLRRKFRNDEGAEAIDMEVRTGIGDALDDVYRLYLETFDRSEVRFEKLSKQFFRDVSERMPEAARYFLWRLNGKLVAFALCLVSGACLVDEYLGMDDAASRRYHLYFRTFRDILTWCLANGIRTYESGAFNYDPKKRLDFSCLPRYVYVRHIDKKRSVMLDLMIAAFRPERFDPMLKVMWER